MNSMKFVASISLLIAATSGASSKIEKRGVASNFGFSSFGGGSSFNFVPQEIPSFGLPSPGPWAAPPVPVFIKPVVYHPAPSPSEIATAIAAAKEASSSVQYAQQKVQNAKEQLLEAQKIASIKEQQANLALKQSEAAAAVQRQAASSAANAVIQAQQRLAEAKAEVADRQRYASAKEAIAAIVIGKSANAAAAEIQRTEHTANKIAALQRHEAQAAIQHVSATKDASLAGVAAAVSAANNAHSYGPGPSGGGAPFPIKKAPFVDYPWG